MIRFRPIFATSWKLIQQYPVFWVLGFFLALGVLFSIGTNVSPDMFSGSLLGQSTDSMSIMRFLQDYSLSNQEYLTRVFTILAVIVSLFFLLTILARSSLAVLLMTNTYQEPHALRRSLRAGSPLVWRTLLISVLGSALQTVALFIFVQPVQYLFSQGFLLPAYAASVVALVLGLLSFIVIVATVHFAFYYYALFANALGVSLKASYRMTVSHLSIVVHYLLRLLLVTLVEFLLQLLYAALVLLLFGLLSFGLGAFFEADVFILGLVLAGFAVWLLGSLVVHGFVLAYIEIAWYWFFRLLQDAVHARAVKQQNSTTT